MKSDHSAIVLPANYDKFLISRRAINYNWLNFDTIGVAEVSKKNIPIKLPFSIAGIIPQPLLHNDPTIIRNCSRKYDG